MRTLALIPALLLAACGQEATEKAQPAPTPSETVPPEIANVVLPPSIVASRTFRCRDQSLVVIDFLSDDRTANVSEGRGKPQTRIEAPAVGQAMVGGGWTVKGGKADTTVTVTAPGGKPVSCRTGAAGASAK